MKAFFLIILSIALAIGSVQSQTLLTETTWGGVGSDVAEGGASAADGSSYVVGITDSFATDKFGNPSPKIFVVKFAPNGSLSWQNLEWDETAGWQAGVAGQLAFVGRDGISAAQVAMYFSTRF